MSDKAYFYSVYYKQAGHQVYKLSNKKFLGLLVGVHKDGHNLMVQELNSITNSYYHNDFGELEYNWASYMYFNKNNFVAGYFSCYSVNEVFIMSLDKDELQELINKLEL